MAMHLRVEFASSKGGVMSIKSEYVEAKRRYDDAMAWYVRHYGAPHMRKAHAIEECEKLGIVPNYVSHHRDYVNGMICAKGAS